jgi:hypothetical protein
MRRQDPVLHTSRIDELRPTQITIGLLEVVDRRKKWRAAKGKERAEMLAEHVAPAVLGPKGRFYIVDHHHLVRALHEEGVPGVFLQVQADFSELSTADFWVALDHYGWVHTYDEHGERTDFAAIPKSIADLRDDPYRSLAGAVRRGGGFAKDVTPFSEFLWAAFYRSRIDLDDLLNEFEPTVERALELAHEREAAYLPGWCGA